jgi:hypothetical protein
VCYRCGRARWRKHLFRRPRWALLLGRGRPDPRGMPRGWATWLPPHAPAHVLSHLWPAARAKAPSRARRSAAQLAWEAAAAQRCRAPTGELVGRWPLAEAGSGGACPAKARRAARELLLSSATVVQGSALQAGSGAERASEPPCDVQHSGDCCVAASKTASWVPRAGRAARPAVAAADWTRHCHACGCAAPAFYHAWHCHARSPQSEWCRHQPPTIPVLSSTFHAPWSRAARRRCLDAHSSNASAFTPHAAPAAAAGASRNTSAINPYYERGMQGGTFDACVQRKSSG